jgi:quercetin dioxygenase-like cupin family protein
MHNRFIRGLCAGTVCISFFSGTHAAGPVQVENLLRVESQVAEGVEIIVSEIEIGPGFRLPKHYHPGEEYVFVLEGEATVWLQDQPDQVLRAGEVYQIPLEQVHTAITGDSSAKAIVFRVHRKGEPDRIPVE